MKWVFLMMTLTLICLPQVLALDTTIQVTSEPNTFIMIRVFEGGSQTNLLESILDRRVDFNNQVTVTHSSDKSRLDIVVYVKEIPNGAAKYYKRYENIAAGSTFAVSLPENATAPNRSIITTSQPAINDTNQTEPTTNVTNITAGTAAPLTGNAIQSSTVLGGIKWYYVVAGAFLAVAILAGGFIMKKKQSAKGPAVMPKNPPGSTKDPTELEKQLQETQARLDQATKEISRIKNEDQIKQLQKNIEAEQEQLRKLQQGLA